MIQTRDEDDDNRNEVKAALHQLEEKETERKTAIRWAETEEKNKETADNLKALTRFNGFDTHFFTVVNDVQLKEEPEDVSAREVALARNEMEYKMS